MKWILAAAVALAFIAGCASTGKPVAPARDAAVFYPPPPDPPRLQFLHSIVTEKDLGKTQSAFSRFILGVLPPAGAVGTAYDVAAAPGKIWFVERTGKKLMALDLAGQSIREVRTQGNGALRDPAGLCVDEAGNVYVADMARKQVLAYGPGGGFVRAYGARGELEKPVDVAVSGNRVYACDLANNQVLVLDRESGRKISVVGKLGSGEGEFYKPSSVVTDLAGNLYVNDSFNFRVQKFDPTGRFVSQVGKLGDLPGDFARPKGLAVSREGHLYVLDAAFENAQIFDAEKGDLLLFFGGPGDGPGDMNLPSGIAMDYANIEYFRKFFAPGFDVTCLVWVTNRFGDGRLSVYGFGGGAPPGTP